MAAKSILITVRITPQEAARLDEMRGSVSRSAFVRELMRRSGPIEEAPTYAEALRLLAESARSGSTQAQVALERALRGAQAAGDDDWLARILDGDDD